MFSEGHGHHRAQAIVSILDPRFLDPTVTGRAIDVSFVAKIVNDLSDVKRQGDDALLILDVFRRIEYTRMYGRACSPNDMTVTDRVVAKSKEALGVTQVSTHHEWRKRRTTEVVNDRV